MILEWWLEVLVDKDGSCVTRLELGGVAVEVFHVGGLLAAGGRSAQLHPSLFPICHGRATPSLISSAYSFTCGPIFLSFFILQDTHGFTFDVPPLTLVLSLFVFFFFFLGKNVELLVFLDFLCVCFPRKFMGLWVYWRLVWFLGFISCFPGFYRDWIWLLDLDLGFARD